MYELKHQCDWNWSWLELEGQKMEVKLKELQALTLLVRLFAWKGPLGNR